MLFSSSSSSSGSFHKFLFWLDYDNMGKGVAFN